MRKQNVLMAILVVAVVTLATEFYIFKTSDEVEKKFTTVEDVNVTFTKIGEINKYKCDTAAVISSNKKNVVITVSGLSSKDSFAIIPVTIKNNGELSAKLYSISEYGLDKDSPIIVEYNGIGVTDTAILPDGLTTFNVKISLEKEISENEIELEFSIKLNYIQG